MSEQVREALSVIFRLFLRTLAWTMETSSLWSVNKLIENFPTVFRASDKSGEYSLISTPNNFEVFSLLRKSLAFWEKKSCTGSVIPSDQSALPVSGVIPSSTDTETCTFSELFFLKKGQKMRRYMSECTSAFKWFLISMENWPVWGLYWSR